MIGLKRFLLSLVVCTPLVSANGNILNPEAAKITNYRHPEASFAEGSLSSGILCSPATNLGGQAQDDDNLLDFPKNDDVTGTASWYSEKDPAINRRTASGDIFDDSQMTCASWDYAFGTILEVTNLKNGKSVFCRVNDRGPAKRLNRVIDLTKSAFQKISDPELGLVRVSVREMDLEEVLVKV